MLIPSRRVAALLGAALFIAAACGGGTTTAPSTEPGATPVATVPEGQLVVATKLTICSDLPYPPLEYFDEQGNPTGSDIELAGEMAKRLGLTLAVQNTVFDTIIAALLGGKCDIIVSDQNITADRIEQVDMIPYFQAGQAFVVAKGNPKNLKTTEDLCGISVAAETGTTEVDYVDGTGDYEGRGLNDACTAAGKPAIDLKQFQKDSDAALALQSGQVDVYFADYPVAANYANSRPDAFEMAPIPQLEPILVGISVPKGEAYDGLLTAVQTVLISMIDDGKYLEILKKFKTEAGAITSDVARQINKTD